MCLVPEFHICYTRALVIVADSSYDLINVITSKNIYKKDRCGSGALYPNIYYASPELSYQYLHDT